jgi:hypothetical protein
MDTAEVERMIEESLPAIREKFKNAIAEQIEHHAVEEAMALVKAHVAEWATTHILPEIAKTLTAEKDGILDAANAAAKQIGVQIANAIAAQAAENLSAGYRIRKVCEALFQ